MVSRGSSQKHFPDAEQQLRAELETSARLLKIGSIFLRGDDPTPVLEEVIESALAIAAADFGAVQLLSPQSGELQIVAQKGFPEWWIEHWQQVETGRGVCGSALQQRERICIEDVETSSAFSEPADYDSMRKVGVRAVQSVPLIGRNGTALGTLSTYFRKPGCPSEQEMRGIDLLVRQLTDILERARIEEELRDSEGRLRALVNASSQVLYSMSPDWSEMRELSSEDFLAETCQVNRDWMQSYIPVAEQERVRAAIAQAIKSRRVFSLEHRVLRADGSEGWVQSRALPVLNAEGEIIEWFGSANDVTERRQAEEALRENARRKDEFIAMLGHELRNPLAAIRNCSEALTRAGELDANALETIVRQARHMGRIVDELLDITRISRGKLNLKRTVFDVRQLLESVLQDREHELKLSDRRVSIEICDATLWVHADRTRLTQVVDNLVANALKFTSPDGTITVIVECKDNNAVIRIRDDGIGFEPDVGERLFDAFEQAPQDAARSSGGLGLGLAVSKGLIELHGGNIEAKSDGPGRGAEFAIRLPLSQAPGDASAGRGIAATPGKLRILVVEDHEAVADSLQFVLRLEGHRVSIAEDGFQALEFLQSEAVDIVLCDIGLPGSLNGYGVAQAIRRDENLKGLTLIAMSGYGQPKDIKRALDTGFDEYLVKPVDVQDLQRIIAQHTVRQSADD